MPKGLTVSELMAEPSPSSIDPAGQIDPDRLEPGSKISFMYWKGTRYGRRREVQLLRKVAEGREPKDPLLLCTEINEVGDRIQRNYYPSVSSDTLYEGETWPPPDGNYVNSAGSWYPPLSTTEGLPALMDSAELAVEDPDLS